MFSYPAFRSLLEGHDFFQVPEVIDELSGRRVLAMELVHGVPLDRCVDLDQETRNQVQVDPTLARHQRDGDLESRKIFTNGFCSEAMKQRPEAECKMFSAQGLCPSD